MGMTVIEVEAILDGMLPIGRLAAQMRLADGVTADPEQLERLRLRLGAAVDAVERRLGRMLIARTVTLAGTSAGGRQVMVPIHPVTTVTSVSVRRGGVEVPLDVVSIEPMADRCAVLLSMPVRPDEALRVSVIAGYGEWTAIPPAMGQAVLLMAEALDAGEGPALVPMAETLLAPYRPVRIGRTV